MVAIVSGTDFPLQVSRRVIDWVDRAERSYQEAFDAALAFAREALPRALAQFGSIEAFVIVHFNSVMIIGLHAESNSFCVFSFHVADHDPCPPDGPGSEIWSGLLATEFAERLGLIFCMDGTPITFAPKSAELLSVGRSGTYSRAAIEDIYLNNYVIKFEINLNSIKTHNEGKSVSPSQIFDLNESFEKVSRIQTFRRSGTDDAHAVDEIWSGLAAFCVREKLFAPALAAQPRNS